MLERIEIRKHDLVIRYQFKLSTENFKIDYQLSIYIIFILILFASFKRDFVVKNDKLIRIQFIFKIGRLWIKSK